MHIFFKFFLFKIYKFRKDKPLVTFLYIELPTSVCFHTFPLMMAIIFF